jgi:hypothetical protein
MLPVLRAGISRQKSWPLTSPSPNHTERCQS